MLRRLLIISLFGLMAAAPVASFASDIESQEPEVQVQDVQVRINGRMVTVSGAEGKTLCVYDAAGNLQCSIEIDSDSKTFSLNVPRGLYIIRVGQVARKVQIR